jgi:hypothetical protein
VGTARRAPALKYEIMKLRSDTQRQIAVLLRDIERPAALAGGAVLIGGASLPLPENIAGQPARLSARAVSARVQFDEESSRLRVELRLCREVEPVTTARVLAVGLSARRNSTSHTLVEEGRIARQDVRGPDLVRMWKVQALVKHSRDLCDAGRERACAELERQERALARRIEQ